MKNVKNWIVVIVMIIIVLNLVLFLGIKFFNEKSEKEDIISLMVSDTIQFDVPEYKDDSFDYIIETLGIIEIDKNGKLVALKEGVTNVIFKNKKGQVIKKYKIVVFEKTDILESNTSDKSEIQKVKELTKIQFLNSEENIIIGNSKKLQLITFPLHIIAYGVNYESDNIDIAKVDENGIVMGLKEGSVTITATVANDIKASLKVNVIKNVIPVKDIMIDTTNTTNILNEDTINILSEDKKIAVGVSTLIKCILTPSNTTESLVKWESKDPNIAMVNELGIVTGKKPGKVIIFATALNGKTSSVEIEVVNNKIQKLLFMNAKESIVVGGTKKTVLLSEPLDAYVGVLTFNSSNESIVKVNTLGEITGVSVGTAVITAKTSDDIVALLEVTVIKEKIDIDKITAVIKDNQINPGEKTSIIYTIEPENATQNKISWKSSNTNIATVDEKGMITGHSLGEATITLTTENGKTSKVKIIVKYVDDAPPVTAPKVEVYAGSINGLLKGSAQESSMSESLSIYSNMANMYIKMSGGLDNVGGSGLDGYAYSESLDGIKTIVKNSVISVNLKENNVKSYYIFTKDKAGNYSKTYKKIIFKLDKISPTKTPEIFLYENNINGLLKGKVSGDTKNQSITMYTNVIDSIIKISGGIDVGSGVTQYAYSLMKAEGGPQEEKHDIKNGEIYFQASNIWTVYYIYSKDNAGNYSKIYTRIAIKLDQEKPTCNWIGESTAWTNINRTISLSCEDALSGCDPLTSTWTKEFSSTASFSSENVTIKDNVGNSTVCSKNVNVYVDKEVPCTTPIITLYTNNSNGSVVGTVASSSKNQSVIMLTNVQKSYLKITGGADVGSGVAGYAYALMKEEGGPQEEKHDIKNGEIYFEAPSGSWQVYYIYTKDKAGNYSKIYTRVAIKYINKTYIFDDTKSTIEEDLRALINKNYFRKQKFAFSSYNANEQKYLNGYLENKIKLSGYGTREGVVAAARFLSVQLNNRVQYISNVGNQFKGINYSNRQVYYPKVFYQGSIYENSTNDSGNFIYNRSFGPYFYNVFGWNTCVIKNGKSVYADGSDCSNYSPPLSTNISPQIQLKENYNSPASSSEILGNEVGGFQCSGFVNWALHNGGYDFVNYNNKIESNKIQTIIDNYGSAISQGSIYKNDTVSANYLCNYIEGSTVYAKDVMSRLSSSQCSDIECSGAYTSYQYVGLRYALIEGKKILDRSLLPNNIMSTYYGTAYELYNNKSKLGTVNLPTSVFLGNKSWSTISNKIKPGDLICRTVGHVGIIVYMDDKYYYVAHQVHWGANGTQLMKVDKSTLIGERYYNSDGSMQYYQWESVVSMENVYNSDKYKSN